MRTNVLMVATVALAVVATASCFKKKDDAATTDTTDAAAAPTEAPAEAPEQINPEWKTKCPDADRPLSGTVTALKDLTVFKTPVDTAEKIGGIGPGTWVNLLGIKQNWYCIDYPCGEKKLCPGWVEERYTQRKTKTDAGVVDAGTVVPEAAAPVVDAAVADAKALVADAGPAPTTTTTGGKVPPGGRPPPIKKK